jgi:plastocyanin
MRKMLIAALVLAALTAVACGGGDDDGGSTGAGPTGDTSTDEKCTANNAADLTGDDPFVVTIQDLAFTPDCFSAASASFITIQNEDPVTHTFTIDDTSVDVSIDGGQKFEGPSAGLEPGRYAFRCKIHATMTGTLFVT